MGADNVLPVRNREIELKGEKKQVWFTMKSFAVIAGKYGSVTKIFEVFEGMAKGSLTTFELYGVSDFISAGLISGDKKFTPEYVADTYDFEELKAVLPVFVESYMAAIGVKSGDDANPQTP